MFAVLLIAALAASPARASVESDEAQAAERLSAHALDTLDGILGPGRVKVHVEVRGERSNLHTESEIVSPIEKGASAGSAAGRYLDLPGYVKEKEKEKTQPSGPVFYQKDHELSDRDSGFSIKSIQATVVLDAALADDAVREVSQLLPQLLKIDTQRGDTLTILRAAMRPAWKSAFATASDWRFATYAGGAALVFLIAALIAASAFVRAGRVLGQELGAARGPGGGFPGGAGEPLPELAAGAPPGLLEGESASGAAGGAAVAMIGRRFDFLIGRDPALIARALSSEKSEDLSLFFGHMAESIPDLASRLFTSLPGDVQAEVSQALLGFVVADPERLSGLEDRLRQAVENGVMGPQSLGRILSRVPDEARADLLGRLQARDARGTEEVERHVFSFESLEQLEPAQIRRLLGAVSYDVWGTALRGAAPRLVDLVLGDLPAGPRELVRAASETPQSKEKITEARSKILDAFAALEAKGEIKQRETGAGDMV